MSNTIPAPTVTVNGQDLQPGDRISIQYAGEVVTATVQHETRIKLCFDDPIQSGAASVHLANSQPIAQADLAEMNATRI